jgi:hypothetical protein
VRPWIWRSWQAVVVALGAGFGLAGGSWWGLVFVGMAVLLEVGLRRTLTEIVLAGDHLVLVTDLGGRTAVPIDEVVGITSSRWRGTRFVTVRRTWPIHASGALQPLLDELRARRPDQGIVGDARNAYEAEWKLAARRRRHPGVTRLCLLATALGLALMAVSMVVVIAERNAIVERAVAVEAVVDEVASADDGRVRVEVSYVAPDGSPQQRALLLDEGAIRSEARSTTIAVDPDDPAVAFDPAGAPDVLPPSAPACFVIAGVLLCAGVLLAPTAFAEPPELDEIDDVADAG